MMYINTKAAPTNDTNYRLLHKSCITCLTNMGIKSLGDKHTHTHTHTHPHKNNFKKPGDLKFLITTTPRKITR